MSQILEKKEDNLHYNPAPFSTKVWRNIWN